MLPSSLRQAELPPSLKLWWTRWRTGERLTARFETLADFGQQFPAPGRIAPLLPVEKSGFRLTLRDDVRDKVVEKPLHARPGGARRAQQRLVPGIVTTIRDCFHFTLSRCCAGVTTRGEANLSSPRAKSRVLWVTRWSTPPAMASSKTWSSSASGRLGRQRK